MAGVSHLSQRDAGPWFRARPQAALVVSVLLFGAVLTLRLADHAANDAISMLYTLPVALVALAFIRSRGGRATPSAAATISRACGPCTASIA